ncbi:hypothetical protein GCM10010327_18320 [Streptomyces nitrosporeus]|nr:hypothetical protein GCM10010327_18320 [Streptomyces nitrosporeus]
MLWATAGDGTCFPTAVRLAPYDGLTPATKPSGTSIHGEHAPRGGNRQLRQAMLLFAVLRDGTFYGPRTPEAAVACPTRA